MVESSFVENPEDRFCHAEAQLKQTWGTRSIIHVFCHQLANQSQLFLSALLAAYILSQYFANNMDPDHKQTTPLGAF